MPPPRPNWPPSRSWRSGETRRKLENVPDSGLDDYVDYHWDDVEAEAAKAGVGAEDLLFDDLVRRNRLDRFGPEVLELISDGLYGEEEVDRAFWMGGILDAIEKARRDA